MDDGACCGAGSKHANKQQSNQSSYGMRERKNKQHTGHRLFVAKEIERDVTLYDQVTQEMTTGRTKQEK
jgi:hypothetical protein